MAALHELPRQSPSVKQAAPGAPSLHCIGSNAALQTNAGSQSSLSAHTSPAASGGPQSGATRALLQISPASHCLSAVHASPAASTPGS
jgi:hypothetical protein